jgi:hypothetical protein
MSSSCRPCGVSGAHTAGGEKERPVERERTLDIVASDDRDLPLGVAVAGHATSPHHRATDHGHTGSPATCGLRACSGDNTTGFCRTQRHGRC